MSGRGVSAFAAEVGGAIKVETVVFSGTASRLRTCLENPVLMSPIVARTVKAAC